MQKLFITLSMLLLVSGCFSSQKYKTSLPYVDDFKNTDGWSLDAGAKFNPAHSASAHSGSIRLSKSGDSWVLSDRITSDIKLPVTPGKSYTLSFKSKTNTWPPPSLEVYGAMVGENGTIDNSNGTMCANSAKGIWEENFVSIKIPKNDAIKYFQIKILMLPKKNISAPIWIDDVRFEEGTHPAHKNIAKKPFHGTITRIDKLGNVEIKKGDRFIPFFPIGIYADNDRKDWHDYKKMGFNMNMWTDNARFIQKAKDAGLYSMMQIVQYIVPEAEDWIPQNHEKKITHLHKTLQEIRDKGLEHDLLFYYIDNEFYHLKDAFTEVVDIVRQEDRHAHPVYMLSGAYGMARKYNDYIDLTGTYVAEDGFETPIVASFEMLEGTPNQTQPVVFAQINRGIGKNFRAVLYGAIAKGAKGVGFWRDGGSAGKIESRPIFKQLPTIAREIKALMPIIRTDHHTAWSASTNSDKLIFGTRMFNDHAYMIIANPASTHVNASFSVQALPYTPTDIQDYFSHKVISKVKNNTFSITLNPYDAKVIQLNR